MNECRRLSELPQHLSAGQIEHILEEELNGIGLEHYVLMILNNHKLPVFQYVGGFTAQQISIYEQHREHDQFLNHYMRNNMQGQFVYLQDMLPMSRIRDQIFNEVLVPTVQYSHSYSGLIPLLDEHYLILSSHSESRLSFKATKKAQTLWRFLRTWGNYWVAQQNMSRQLSELNVPHETAIQLSSLTTAEIEVLKLLVQGFDGSEVAQRRNVSKETIKSQIKQILHKTGCRHQNQLLSRYFSSGAHVHPNSMSLSV